jgi:FkbM family methyltransferase
MGTIAVPVALSGLPVIAVEMLPMNCLRLWAAAARNGLPNLHIVQAAASDHDGTVKYQGAEAWGYVTAGEEGPSAVCLRLDTLMRHYESTIESPLVLKLDVEQHEPAVLRGARETIARYRPVILFESIEIEGERDSSGAKSRRLVAEEGYDLFLTRGRILSPKDALDLQEGYVVDYLGVPKGLNIDFAALGYEVRVLTDEERLAWVDEMASFHMKQHQLHAANVLLRWEAENPGMARNAKQIADKLLALDTVSDHHDALRRFVSRL